MRSGLRNNRDSNKSISPEFEVKAITGLQLTKYDGRVNLGPNTLSVSLQEFPQLLARIRQEDPEKFAQLSIAINPPHGEFSAAFILASSFCGQSSLDLHPRSEKVRRDYQAYRDAMRLCP